MSSLAVYRDTIADLGRMIDALTLRRDTLKRRLDWRADRSFAKGNALADYTTLPDDLPVPANDGAADQLPGRSTLALTLQTSDGDHVDLGDLGLGRTVVYPYPLTGHPGADLPEGWDAIPGARGCSTEATHSSSASEFIPDWRTLTSAR